MFWREEKREASRDLKEKLPMEIWLGTQASGKSLKSGWKVWEWYLFINKKFTYKVIVGEG